MLKQKSALILLMLATLLLCSFSAVSAQEEQITITLSVWGMPWEDKIYTEFAIPKFGSSP